METICPLLTIGGDARVVSGTPDAAHRCSAGGSLSTIEREHQSRFCLGGRYETCERYRMHLEHVGPIGATWGPAAPDATFSSTRLVIEQAPRTALAGRPRRLGMAATILIALLVIGAAAAWVWLGGPQGLLGPSAGSPTPSATAAPSATGTQSEASPSASPSRAPGPTPTPLPTPVPSPTPVTYIVQAGDTLNAIAARFGTTAQAIIDANGLTSEIILVGQVLIIPMP